MVKLCFRYRSNLHVLSLTLAFATFNLAVLADAQTVASKTPPASTPTLRINTVSFDPSSSRFTIDVKSIQVKPFIDKIFDAAGWPAPTYTEDIPAALPFSQPFDYATGAKGITFDALRKALQDAYGLAIVRDPSMPEGKTAHYYVSLAAGSVSAGKYRMAYDAKSGYTLTASSIDANTLTQVLVKLGGDLKGSGIKDADPESLVKVSVPSVSLSAPSSPGEAIGSIMMRSLAPRINALAGDPPVVSIWPMTFVRSDVPRPTPSALAATTALSGDKLSDPELYVQRVAKEISGLYPQLAVTSTGQRLVLRGTKGDVERMRRQLAQYIDIPYAQVQLDCWTVQVNSRSTRGGQKERAQAKMETIRQGIQMARDLNALLYQTLTQYVQRLMASSDGTTPLTNPTTILRLVNRSESFGGVDNLALLMQLSGFELDPQRPLSTAEMLVLLSFLPPDPTPEGRLADLRKKAREAVDGFKTHWRAELEEVGGDPAERRDLRKLLDRMVAAAHGSGASRPDDWASEANPLRITLPFEHLSEAYACDFFSDRRAVTDFFKYWLLCDLPNEDSRKRIFTKEPKELQLSPRVMSMVGGKAILTEQEYDGISEHEDIAARLAWAGSGADDELKSASAALDRDLKEACTEPLLQWIRDTVQGGSSANSGIDLVGNTSIVVTSREPAQVASQAESYLPYQAIPKLKDVLTGGQAVLNGRTDLTSAAADISGVLAIANPIGPLLALAIGEGLAETDPVYNRIAPGISLGVRPTVLRDGGSARLQISLTTALDAAQNATPAAPNGPPVDLIKSHQLTSDLAVGAQDIFELSTFAEETSGPGEPTYRIPVLEVLPFIGRYFDGPPRHEVRHQESLIIVKVTILPRSLDLAGQYLR